MSKTDCKYFVYWIISGRSSYIGATVDPVKRLRQHCGVIKGGAKHTRGKLWTYKWVVSGFRTWNEALKFEWRSKFDTKRCRGIESRQLALEKVLQMERWTSTSPPSSDVPLTVEFNPTHYGMPPETLPTPVKSAPKPKTKCRRKWKKNLHGVTY